MKKYKTLYNIMMYIFVALVTAYLYYRFAVYLNSKNDYHVNKDMWIFNMFAGIVGAIIRSAYLEYKKDDTTIEDEMRDYMMNDTNRFISDLNKQRKIDSFKFFRGEPKIKNKTNLTNDIGPR